MDRHDIAAEGISAIVKADGAELCSLHDATGREVLWQGGPPWPRHAPVLFPIVGRLAGDRLRHRGRDYRLTQHGFARDRRFTWAECRSTSCRLVLQDDDQTRAAYPFAFRLEVGYAAEPEALSVGFSIINTGSEVLPASIGAHPAFLWPLQAGISKTDHRLEFEAAETAPVRRLSGGLLLAERFATPIDGRTLSLTEALFAPDAIIVDQLASRSVRYSGGGARSIEVSWDAGFRQLGIWSRADADLLCIEPWHGFASPIGFAGEFLDKPGIMLIPAGEKRDAGFRIRLAPE